MRRDDPPIDFNSGPLPVTRHGGQQLFHRSPRGGRSPIPDATFPPDPTGQATPSQLSGAASSSGPQQLVTAGRDSVLPIIYGGPERTAGKLYLARAHPTSGALVLVQLLAEGGASGVEAIASPEMNDQAVPAGVTITAYLGTQSQTVDPTLAAIIPGFTEAMPGTAYVVIQIPKGLSPGFPRFTFEVKGMKIYDPRDGTQTLGVANSYKWSDNPALILADFLANTGYGASKSVDWPSVTTAANYCDATVTGTAGTEKRALLSLTLGEKRHVREWIEVLRAYIPAWIDYQGMTAVIVVDAARANDHTFTAANIDVEPKPTIRKRGVKDLPTVVEIGYLKTDVKPWAMAYAEASTGSGARRKARVDMPGIRRYSQARRFAVERLNHYTLETLEASIGVFEDGLKVSLGDVATVTDDLGLSAKLMRVMGKDDRGHGRWTLALRAYDPAAYSTLVESTPSTPDTGLPNPKTVAAPTALVITETVFLEQISGSTLAGGLIYQSRFDCTWAAPVHAYPFVYRVELWDGPTKLRDETTTTPAYSTPAVQQGKSYTVKVFTRNLLGPFESAALSGAQSALGKLLPPGPVPAITRAFEAGGKVLLAWSAAVDIDVMRYEWRYFPNGTGTWASATLIDRVDGLTALFEGIPVGTHRFYVRAIDSVGNYSTSDATVDIAVTSDANAFIQDRTFSAPTLTNMVAITPLEGVNKLRWETAFAADQWNTVEPNPFNSGANPVVSYHAAGTSKFVGESWDLGLSLSGDWSLAPNSTDVSGIATYAIETSADGSTWTAQPGVSFRGPARFVRPVIQTTGTLLIFDKPKISLAVLSRPETGLTRTLGSGLTLVLLTGKYSAAQDVQVSIEGPDPATGTLTSRTAIYDRLLLHPQAGLCLYSTSTAGDAFAIQNISAASKTIVADDYLEYDVFIDPASPAATTLSNGGLTILFSDATTTSTLNDVDGYNCVQPAVAFDALARGTWKSRKIALGTKAALTITSWRIRNDSDGVGAHKTLFRNIRITNGAGTDRLVAYTTPGGAAPSGEPTVNTLFASGLSSNIQCGPSNSLTLYAYLSSTGGQLAADVRWSFKGF